MAKQYVYTEDPTRTDTLSHIAFPGHGIPICGTRPWHDWKPYMADAPHRRLCKRCAKMATPDLMAQVVDPGPE